MDTRLAYNQLRGAFDLPAEIKPKQLEVLRALQENKNVLCILPTGYGKSLCYGIFPKLLDLIYQRQNHYIAIIISPLKSLMYDQEKSWRDKGLTCAAIRSSQEMDAEVEIGIERGDYSLILASPEMILKDRWWEVMAKLADRVCLLAIDEAHCCVTWGESFRETFKEVHQLRTLFAQTPILALTATMTQQMASTLKTDLRLESEWSTIGLLPDRPEIFLDMERIKDLDFRTHLTWLRDDLQKNRHSCPKTLIYARSHDAVAQIYGWLLTSCHVGDEVPASKKEALATRPVEMFHGNTTSQSQERILLRLKESPGSLRVVVATIAFGMGVDIQDVRRVIHWGVSKDLIGYWQEVGRCSRDGRAGRAITYVYPHSMRSDRVSEDMRMAVTAALDKGECLRKNIMAAFRLVGLDRRQTMPEGDCCFNCENGFADMDFE